jgi:hypothetical protein
LYDCAFGFDLLCIEFKNDLKYSNGMRKRCSRDVNAGKPYLVTHIVFMQLTSLCDSRLCFSSQENDSTFFDEIKQSHEQHATQVKRLLYLCNARPDTYLQSDD